MSLIGSMIIIGALALGGSIGIVAAIKHFAKSRPMKIIPFEKIAEAHGDWVTTSAKFPKSGVLRESEPRGM